MKVTCTSCHKKFDNDKYYGICPKCGAFNRISHSEQEDHQRFHEMYDDTNAHSEYGKHEHYHEEYDDTASHTTVNVSDGGVKTTFSDEPKKQKRNKPSVARIVWIIIVAAFFCNFFTRVIMMLFSHFQYMKMFGW